jgi:hypothetical protein
MSPFHKTDNRRVHFRYIGFPQTTKLTIKMKYFIFYGLSSWLRLNIPYNAAHPAIYEIRHFTRMTESCQQEDHKANLTPLWLMKYLPSNENVRSYVCVCWEYWFCLYHFWIGCWNSSDDVVFLYSTLFYYNDIII